MTLLSASTATPGQGAETARTPGLRLLTLATLAPFLLLGCAAEEEPNTPAPETAQPEPSASQDAEPEPSSTPESDESSDDSPGDEDQGEIPRGEGPGGQLPDPDELDLERTEELGAYFSEEEACMSIGSMLEGLQNDMSSGVADQDVLDEIYSAVEQNYILVPLELREPLENILTLVETDVDSLDEEAVLVAAEPVDGWLTVGFCEGEYHNQNPGDDA